MAAMRQITDWLEELGMREYALRFVEIELISASFRTSRIKT
jgi:hypothetical protein